ncbi:MAG: glutaminase, partial [Acidimicrobiia bacterium]|nr:glutaminase [Acidimicrobiia bacterium]
MADADISGSSAERRARREWFERVLVDLHERYRTLDEGVPASYIPELATVDPDRFAIAGFTVDGQLVGVGDVDHRFTIQSISKLLLYGLALETHGRERVLDRVGVAPTGDPFNSIELDDDPPRAPNPMVNAGAIAVTDLVAG